MTNRESYNKEQFEKAGEQAAQVLGRFISFASEISNEIGRKSENPFDHRPGSDERSRSDEDGDVLREAGEQLQKMREAAGYTLDSFAEALKKEMNRPDIEGADVAIKVEAAESGHESLPRDWLHQVYSLLGSSDPMQFFERLQKSYNVQTGTVNSTPDKSDASHRDSVKAERVSKFAALFEGDDELANCTNEQFEKLLGFVENSYKEAKNLVINK